MRQFRASSWRNFGSWITTKDWSEVYSASLCSLKYQIFSHELSSAIDTFFPWKSVKNIYMKGLEVRQRSSVGSQGDNQHLFNMIKTLLSTSSGGIKFSKLLSLLDKVSITTELVN